MVVFSILFLSMLSWVKFKTLRNPAFYFILIHYFHNLSFSTLKKSGLDIFWNAAPTVDFNTIDTIVRFNLISLWLVAIILIIFISRKDLSIEINYFIKKNNFPLIIYILFSFFLLYINKDLITGSLLYGGDQALDSASAFNPLATLLNIRIFFITYYLIFNKYRNRTLIFIIFFELFMSFILGERKDLAIVIFTIFFLFLNNRNNKFNFKIILSSMAFIMVGVLIPIYRSLSDESGFFNKLSLSIDFLLDQCETILYYLTGFASSEGVQNWTLQLINDGSLKLQFGLSYLQGIINIIILRPFQPEWLVNSQAAYYFKSVAYPNTTNTGYDFSFSAEAILNFGINGGYISYFLLSLFLVFLYKGKTKTIVFYKMLIWPVLIISLRTDSTAMFRIFSYIYFVPIIIILIKSFFNVWNSRRI